MKFIADDILTVQSFDSRYPHRLIEAGVDTPLYLKGSTHLNARHVVAIVGTRSATIYAREVINKIVNDLSNILDDILIVSGLALGCDSLAHTTALETKLPTVGVMAHGLDTIYPSQNIRLANLMLQNGGALLSQYSVGTRMHRSNFLSRNKIIAAMSDCVIVAESAADRGGALHTARYAKRIGKNVFAIPGRLTDKYSGGCNMLIAEGTANILAASKDITSVMGWQTKDTHPTLPGLEPQIPTGQAAVITDYLRINGGEQTADNISTALGIPTGTLLALLIDMEFDGFLIALPGNRFRLSGVI